MTKIKSIVSIFCILLFASVSLFSQARTETLKIGQKAPDFSTEIQTGEQITLSQYAGKWIVLFFYPKDDTPGCTIEACSFRDDFSKFKDVNTVILGISADDKDSHNSFIEKFSLNFDLISDTKHEYVNAYNVLKEYNFDGEKFMGIERSTFIIAPDGTLAEIYRAVKAKGHSQEVYNKIIELQKNYKK